MKWLSTILITLILSVAANAQNAAITGWIVDKTGTPIQFASIVLLSQNTNKPIAQTTSGEKGTFKLEAKAGEAYVLKIFQLNYDLYSVNIASFANADMGRITLNTKSDNLKEVTVVGNPPLITRKVDRVVLNVQSNPLTAGKSSLELFKLAPGVSVLNGNISINGITHARVMLNGRMLNLAGAELINFLTTLRAEEIASIEIIANPPAEYAASAGGLINIVYKKQRKDGLNGSISSSYVQGRYAGAGESASLNYKQNKVTLFGSYSMNWDNGYGSDWTTRTNDKGDFNYKESSFRKDTYAGRRLRVGGIYDINKNQYMGIEYSNSGWKEKSPYQTITTLGNTGAKDIVLNGIFPQNHDASYNNLGYNYNIKLDSLGTALTFTTDYTWNTSTKKNSAASNYYDEVSGRFGDTSYRNTIPANSQVYSADIKLDKPLSKSAAISLGGKLVMAAIDNDVQFENFKNATWIKDLTQSYQYRYKEDIYAGFLNYTGTVFKTDIKIGLRAEYTNTDGHLLTADTVRDNRKSYLGWFPSLFLQKTLNEKAGNSIAFSFRRGIDRPSYTQLNPFVIYIDNYTTLEGNPYLKPQYANSFQLTYTYHEDYSLSFIYQRANDVIFNILHTRPGDSLSVYYAPENLDIRDNYIVILSTPLQVTKWWNMNNTFAFKQEKMKFKDFQYNKPIVFIQTAQDIVLPAKMRLSVSGLYYSNIMQGNIAVDGFYRIDMGLQKAFMKDKLIAKINVNDVFNTEKSRTKTIYQHYIQNGLEKNQTQSIALQLIYNFKLGKAFTVKEMDRSNSDEKSRLGSK
ncbi:outer membrane beta-barrel protein [Chitinophaga niastensis]|uniref:Outer membrane beta-barrel protein n=1 Tax=Chitinophaga niastensis TaxID=536980 RepID=A0A2P8HTB0_CHINA|nr:outer membrane beta-barrel family protein [Chitinophaga niastensis]PSL49471.1 outer membrane beta-barrel protein [Chitinophaga niastensis]